MTPTVVFENPGVLDPRAIRTFGISAKETKSPIGFFGTGLKYAIAVLLREGHEITIHAGPTTYYFQVRQDNMRGKDFEMIQYRIEGGEWADLPFTTELGKTWKIWQAFREIYCNCIDEGGIASQRQDDYFSEGRQADHTYVVVKGADFYNAYRTRDEIVLRADRSQAIVTGEVDVYAKRSGHVYYRGIRAMELKTGSNFTFNIIDQMELTEDRTIKHPYLVEKLLVESVSKIKSKTAIRRFILPEENSFEAEMNYHHLMFSADSFSEEFMEVMAEAYEDRQDKMNSSAKSLYMKVHAQKAVKNHDPEALTEVEQIQLKKAEAIVKRIVPSYGKFKMIVVRSLGDDVQAQADLNERVIVLSKKCFRFGTKFLVATLIEEHFHLETGYGDMTRQFQTYLFDFICTMAEEHILKEPM